MRKTVVILALLLASLVAQSAEARVDCIANGSLGEGCYDCVWIVILFPYLDCFEVLYPAYCGCDTSIPYVCTADAGQGLCDYEGPGCDGLVCPEG